MLCGCNWVGHRQRVGTMEEGWQRWGSGTGLLAVHGTYHTTRSGSIQVASRDSNRSERKGKQAIKKDRERKEGQRAGMEERTKERKTGE